MAWAILAILVIIAFVLIGMYNSLVQLRVRTDTAWSDIDVQLKRRHDLIPNLVETVKGYAAHEKSTFENVTKFRSQAMQATTPGDKAIAENQLSGALTSIQRPHTAFGKQYESQTRFAISQALARSPRLGMIARVRSRTICST